MGVWAGFDRRAPRRAFGWLCGLDRHGSREVDGLERVCGARLVPLAVLGHHVAEPLLTDAVAADQGMDVALDLHRLAHIGAHDTRKIHP